jgi:hypothetical protein
MNRLQSSLLLLALSSLAACGDSTSPNEAVAGTYNATTIIFTPAGGAPVDVLALGGSLHVDLTSEGTTTGTLVIPAAFTEDGVDDDVIDLAGTYTRTGNTITFQGQGDSFFPEVVWTIGNGTLSVNTTQPGGTIEVTLTRS